MTTDIDYNAYFRKMIFEEIAMHRYYARWWQSKIDMPADVREKQVSEFTFAASVMCRFAKSTLHISDSDIEEYVSSVQLPVMKNHPV